MNMGMTSQPDIASVMRTLADPTRRAVFEQVVAHGEIAAGALTAATGVPQPAVSQHLRALREARRVQERRVGRNIFYRPVPMGLAPLVDWLGIYGVFWRERFGRLAGLLKDVDHE